MKKIAVVTGGLLPMPSVRGGAIETLLQYYIDYNEKKESFNIDIFSIYNADAIKYSKKYKLSSFNYVKISSFLNFIIYNFFRILRRLGFKDLNFQILYLKKVCKLLKSKKYDFVMIESDNHFVIPIKKVVDCPIMLYLHNDKLNSDVKDCYNIASSCNYILTVSDYIKRQVLSVDEKFDDRTSVILNGIDTKIFNLTQKDKIRSEYRKKYNISEDKFVFVFSGRIEPNKGVLELVKAFNLIKNEKIVLMIMGGSFYSSNRKTSYIKQIESEINSNSNVIFTGYIKHDEIPMYLCMADCMVSPSMWEEPANLTNLEAFASSLPVITSESGGIPEYSKNTKAILVKKDDKFIDNLAFNMKKLSNDKNLCSEIGKSEFDVSTNFSSERYCKDLDEYLKKVVD